MRVTTLLSSSTFLGLGLPTLLSQVLADRGITSPTPIQAATLADAIAGRDVLGRGRTGSGKTYAFLLPMVTRLSAESRRPQPNRPRAIILAPTREPEAVRHATDLVERTFLELGFRRDQFEPRLYIDLLRARTPASG